jgi:hypothetical protein
LHSGILAVSLGSDQSCGPSGSVSNISWGAVQERCAAANDRSFATQAPALSGAPSFG